MTFSNSVSKPVQTYVCMLVLLFVILGLLWLDNSREMKAVNDTPSSKRLVCYYCFNDTDLTPELINFQLCTHIIAAFVGISPNNSIVYSEDKGRVLKSFAALANKNPDTKAMISVGGAGDSSFGPMISNHTTRKMFIRSVMQVLKEYKLDGIDLDWEWPVISGGSAEKVKFIQLLHEIRAEFDRHKKVYILSAAVAAVESIILASYYVPHIAENVDFINVMSYDYHFFTTFYPVTDFNAPLYPEPRDAGGALENFNINYTVHLWLSLGMPAEKIQLGLPFYGHSFRLRNPANHGRLAPAAGFGLGDQGFVTYNQVCEFIHPNGFASTGWSNFSRVPYAYDFNNWLSYDNELSLSEKVELVTSMKLGGVMVYSLNSDDYSGNCLSGIKFPLLQTVHSKLFTEYKIF